MKNFTADIDIDVSDRKKLLKHVPHIVGITNDGNKHATGVYFQKIDFDEHTNTSKMKPSVASEHGYFKIDFLNLSIYDEISSNDQLYTLLEQPTNWSLLNDRSIVNKLLHVSKYYDQLVNFKVESLDDMATFLALIRPAKKYLAHNSKDFIKSRIWEPPKNENDYYYKKSHAYSYAMTIKLQLNLIEYQTEYNTVLDLLGKNTK